ncbi:pyridoxal phosphate-dependent aminotransferase [Micrococcoides hystricis]|uniref:Aminotransferase n=1 Tax=Micrococcoides hystricis TaxID=1572761 RepID=A0ABV6P8T8_9MICC
MKISRRGQVPSFKVMDIMSRVAELRAEQRPVISLSAGEPAAGAPADVRQAAIDVQTSGVHLGYTAIAGRAELRTELVEHYRRWYGLELSIDDFVLTTGASGAFLLTFLAAFDPGDRVALACPGYPAYRNILQSVDCVPVDLPAGAESRFQPTVAGLEAEVAAHGELQGLIIASPANPTGTMITPDEFSKISQWCRKNDVLLISDEIYHGITYPTAPKTMSAWELDRNHVVISSFSKFWGMPGSRLGWMLVPEFLRNSVSSLAGNVALCAPHTAQLAAVAGFTESSYAEAESHVATYAANRQRFLDALPELGFGEPAPADGAFYVYLPLGRMAERYENSIQYCSALLEEKYVAIVPGLDFDPVEGGDYVRVNFAVSEEDMTEAIERMIAFNKI